jgi:hypothetical protein
MRMIYRSNLQCPDLRPYFKLATPAIQILGHDAPSDPDFEHTCTFWTDDEAAMLFNIAKQVGGDWVDLGARLGWTSRCVLDACAEAVFAVDMAYEDVKFLNRAMDQCPGIIPVCMSAQKYLSLSLTLRTFNGFVIDADHDAPQPLLDAQGCHRIANPDAVILMHDFWGRPIQDAVLWLMDNGWRCRIYNTPNGVALMWRGWMPEAFPVFRPPDHVPDPAIDWPQVRRDRVVEFPWERTE